MTQTWIKYSTEESKYGGQIIFFKSVEQLSGYPRLLKTVVTDADGQTVKVIYKTYNPEMRNYQTNPCMNRSEKNMKGNNLLISNFDRIEQALRAPETLQKFAENLLAELDQTVDCAVWDCSECPLDLKETEEYSRHGKHICGWLLLEEATLKILRK